MRICRGPCALLAALGHDVHSVAQEGLSGKADREIWKVTQREARFFVTQDLDFADLRKFPPGTHHGILLIRLEKPSPGQLRKRVEELYRKEPVCEWDRCLVVATEYKVRVRAPT